MGVENRSDAMRRGSRPSAPESPPSPGTASGPSASTRRRVPAARPAPWRARGRRGRHRQRRRRRRRRPRTRRAVGRDVDAHRVHEVPLVSGSPMPVSPCLSHLPRPRCTSTRHCSRLITSPSNARKSMSAGVDIGWWRGYGFSRSPERQQGLAEMNCRQAVPAVQVVAGRCGGGVSEPGLLQDGDGTDGRTGWPAVIRGRRRGSVLMTDAVPVSAVRSTQQ